MALAHPPSRGLCVLTTVRSQIFIKSSAGSERFEADAAESVEDLKLKLCERTGTALADFDLIELNEAFAVQAVALTRVLELDAEKVNVNGGAIALGHPLGATGTRLCLTLLFELRRREARYGVASACIGGGQGIAILLERV